MQALDHLERLIMVARIDADAIVLDGENPFISLLE